MRSHQLVGALLLTLVGTSLSNPDARPTRTTDLLRREALAQEPTKGVGDAIQGETEPVDEEEEKDSKTTKKSDAKETGKATGTKKEDDEPTETDKNDKKKTTKTTKIPATAQVGVVNLETPGIFDPFSYYPIGEILTFGWNYTNLIVTPTAINVEAHVAELGNQYFPITMNASGSLTKAEWDTGEYQKNALAKLPDATYTLVISDASRGRRDVAPAGYLGTFQNHRFALYTPKLAESYNDFKKNNPDYFKSSAIGAFDPRMIRVYVAMASIATLSFTVFLTRAF